MSEVVETQNIEEPQEEAMETPEVETDIEPLEETYALTLTGKDCAVVFKDQENFEIFVPHTDSGNPITKQMWMVLLVQELMADGSMMAVLAQRVMDSDKVQSEPPPEKDVAPETEGE